MSQDRAADIAASPIEVAQRGYGTWAAKPHNKRWVKLIDGTPIPNDVVVCIAEAFGSALTVAREEGMRVGLEEAAKEADALHGYPDIVAECIRSLAGKETT